jgi:hypothetical protein
VSLLSHKKDKSAALRPFFYSLWSWTAKIRSTNTLFGHLLNYCQSKTFVMGLSCRIEANSLQILCKFFVLQIWDSDSNQIRANFVKNNEIFGFGQTLNFRYSCHHYSQLVFELFNFCVTCNMRPVDRMHPLSV